MSSAIINDELKLETQFLESWNEQRGRSKGLILSKLTISDCTALDTTKQKQSSNNKQFCFYIHCPCRANITRTTKLATNKIHHNLNIIQITERCSAGRTSLYFRRPSHEAKEKGDVTAPSKTDYLPCQVHTAEYVST